MKKEKSKTKEKTKSAVDQQPKKKSQPRQLKGVVVSTKMQKTIVVSVSKFVQHPKYKKRYKVTKKYKAHDEKEEYKEADRVIIQEGRPISKSKSWRVIGKI